jgi:hypothetical protein
LIVERSGERQYKQFVRDLVRFRDVYMRASGTIEARIVTAAAHKDDPVVISGLPFDAVLRLNGLNGFQSDSASYSNDVIRVLDNLNVYGADTNGRLQFSISQAFIKRRQGLGRVGLLLDAPLEFELFHQPAVADVIDISDFDDSLSVADEWKKNNRLTVNSAQTEQQESLGIKLGTVLLPQLDLTSRASSCTNRLVNRVTNQSWQFPADRFVYCPLSTSGHFQLPTLERNDELCTDRRRCPARSFLTSYIGGHRYFGHGVSLSLKAMASGAIEDLELAIPFMIIRNITLPGYMTSSKSSSNTPPYPILRQIIVSPGKNIISGRLWCWLDFYNPLRVPLRFYYVDVNTYSDGVLIGNLNVNLTRYDPFELKQSYRFSGYPKRRIFNSDDTFGPHASDGCISMGDCQVGPIDLPTSVDSSVLTDRLEVSFNINSASVRAFWKSISQRSTNETITPVLAKGRVLIGIGAPTFNGPPRHDSGGAQRPDDPYWFPADPQREPVVLTWLDFGQRNTPMTFRQPSMPPPRWP